MSYENQALLGVVIAWTLLGVTCAWVVFRLAQGAGDDPDEPRPGQATVDFTLEDLDAEIDALLANTQRRNPS